MHLTRLKRTGQTGEAAPKFDRKSSPRRKGYCSVDGCGRDHYGKGLCQFHYQRVAAGKDVHQGRAPATPCSMDGCDLSVASYASGLCGKHLHRLKSHGDPSVVVRPVKRQPDECVVPTCTATDLKGHGLCSKHRQRLYMHGDPMASGPPMQLRCKVCDSDDEDVPALPASRSAKRLGVAIDTIQRHRRHIDDPEWHGRRAAWWVGELQALQAAVRV